MSFAIRAPRARVVAAAVVAIVAGAACGGGGSSKSSASPTTAAGDATTSTSSGAGGSGANGNCYTTAGTQKARVRFVNLFTNSTYPSTDLDVFQGSSATDPCGKKLATVPYGTASDYIEVTASDESGDWSATAQIAGSTARDHQIISQSETWKGGEQVTIVFQGSEGGVDLPPSSGGDQTLFESGGSDTSTLAAVPGKALLAIGATSLQYVVKDGSWRAGVTGRAGCLRTTGDTDSVATTIGGTQVIPYPVAPGSLSVALYPSDPGTCTGTPAIGPATVDAADGSRTYVFAYGTDAGHLKLLVLPIAGS